MPNLICQILYQFDRFPLAHSACRPIAFCDTMPKHRLTGPSRQCCGRRNPQRALCLPVVLSADCTFAISMSMRNTCVSYPFPVAARWVDSVNSPNYKLVRFFLGTKRKSSTPKQRFKQMGVASVAAETQPNASAKSREPRRTKVGMAILDVRPHIVNWVQFSGIRRKRLNDYFTTWQGNHYRHSKMDSDSIP